MSNHMTRQATSNYTDHIRWSTIRFIFILQNNFAEIDAQHIVLSENNQTSSISSR